MPVGRGELRTTGTSLWILERIAEEGGATLRELVEDSGLAKSTVHKHLSTLRTNELLVKRGEQYILSLQHLALGKRAVETRESYSLVEQKIEELRSRTNGEIDFTVEENGRLIMLYDSGGTTSEAAFGPGTEFHLHNTAAGKAILATYPEWRVDEILDDRGMPKATSRTIESRERLKSELADVRAKGYALNDEECIEGYRTVSSVIMNPDGTVLGAISIGGPVYRIEKTQLENNLANMVRDSTAELTETLAATSSARPQFRRDEPL